MKKNDYLSPEVEIVELEFEAFLLGTSGDVDSELNPDIPLPPLD